MKETVLVIGGDKRSYIAADLISNLGYTVFICGFEKIAENTKLKTADYDNLPAADYVLLPTPYNDADGTIKMPFSDTRLTLTEVLKQINQKTCVILGGADWEAQTLFDELNLPYCDLLSDETYTIQNAYITAQAAVITAAGKGQKALFDCSILVCGYGRIGKTLAPLLKSFGARVTVSARKDKDLEWIGICGFTPVHTDEIEKVIGQQDIIFNTIPHRVLNRKELIQLKNNALLFELASKPYGINFEEASKLEINTFIELGLPGRCFPYSAAKTIAEAFQRIVKKGW